jgi:type IV pilus assembly protein PilW
VTAGDGIPTLVRSEFDLSGGTLAHQAAVPLIEGIQGFRVELGIDSLSETGDPVDYTAEIDWDDDENLVTPTNRGDGVPDGAFVHCSTAIECTVEQLRNVVAVRLYILARADRVTPGYTDNKTHNLGGQALGPFNDGFKRHVFSTSVRLMNVSTRRETP